MAGFLDFIGSQGGGGLFDFLRNNAFNQQFNSGRPEDQAQYGAAPQYNPPMQAMAQMQPQSAPQQYQPQPQAYQASQDTSPGFGTGFLNNLQAGPIGALIGGIGTAAGLQDPALQAARQQANVTAQALRARGVPEDAIIAAVGNGRTPGNTELLKTLVDENFKTKTPMNLGNGQVLFPGAKTATKLYEPDDKTPTSVLEYKYYRENLPAGEKAMPYDVWSTAKSRAGATNISNNIDMNSGQTYDKQLAEGLGKAHASLANGVEDAQTRARDIAAMQGAVDAIQKNGGTTGGLGQQQILDLKKTVNAGASAVGIDKPFNEGDLADKEFLTKFNRSMAGAQAKNAVGARVTNFEMGNFLKANPGLDMSVTGNQRLLGIQAQIEERNIAVGNQVRDATAEAISRGEKINPVTVQKIIKGYDDQHHIKDVVTGQDLTQSYALPEFQNGATNSSMAKAHGENLKAIEKTIGGKTYVQRDGQWYVK